MKHDDDQTQDRSAIRLHNRALRLTNRKLRREQDRLRRQADELFLAVCDTETDAEKFFGELWGSGEYDCGPQDYAYMVEQSIAAVRAQNATRFAGAAQTQSSVPAGQPSRWITDTE